MCVNNQVKNIDSCIKRIYANIDVRFKAIILSSFVFGLLAHGMALFNQFSIHDDVFCIFDVGSTYCLGRWFLEILQKITSTIFICHYSTPLFKGLLSILFIALSCCFVVKTLKIKNIVTCIFISGIMITTPVVANLFGYMFTAPYYMFAVLLSSIAVYLLNEITENFKSTNFIISSLLICFSIGIYQAFIPYTLSFMMMCFIKKIYENEDDSNIIKSAIIFSCSMIPSLGLYFIFTKIALIHKCCELSTYQNINTIYDNGISVYFNRIADAYSTFCSPKLSKAIYPMNTLFFYRVSVVLNGLFFVCHGKRLWQQNYRIKAFLLILSYLCLPIVFNFIYVMCDKTTVHQLMLYGNWTFILCAILSEESHFANRKTNEKIYNFCAIAVFLTSLIWIRFDNVIYMKAEFRKHQLISYCTTLITRIKSCYNYRSEYPIVFIGNGGKNDKTISDDDKLNLISCMPWYPLSSCLNFKYSIKMFMKMWCGYSPVIKSSDEYEKLSEVISMPCYPDYGSVKVVNDTVVVKLENK